MATRERKAPKTWSRLGDVKRRPSTYDVTASQFAYHFRREPAPFEMGPEAPINQWYLKHREGSAFNVDDWEGFRDPARLTYSDYVTLQHDRETYLDALVDHHEDAESVASYDEAWAHFLTRAVVPLRFPLHVLQMCALYVGQMAPSAFIINCANFQAADEMRRIQRLAYFTRMLADSHSDAIAETATARDPWEKDEHWHLRELLERLLVVYDWGQAFVALNLVVKPTIDALVNDQLALVATDNGDELLALMLGEFGRDSQRSADWTSALVRYAIDRGPALAPIVRDWVDEWVPLADESASAWAQLLTSAPRPADAGHAVAAAASQRSALIASCGL